MNSHSTKHQVLVVTHLAQIAARADHHFKVSKHEIDGRTRVTVEQLEGEARVHGVGANAVRLRFQSGDRARQGTARGATRQGQEFSQLMTRSS